MKASEVLADARARHILPERPDLWPLRDNWIRLKDDGVALVSWRQPVLESSYDKTNNR